MSVFTNSASRSREDAQAYITAILGLLGDQEPLDVLRRTDAALRKGVDGMSDRQLGTPEAPGKWSVRHVVRHLADAEIVWGWRLRVVLAQSRPPLTGFDQDLWADRLGYADANVAQALDEFRVMRRGHLWLLDRASPDDLTRVGVHAERGDESVAHMIRLYAGHDLLHVRQIARIRAAVS
jgi:DinB superfamily